jgi:iron complex transport system ATP-binding protein
VTDQGLTSATAEQIATARAASDALGLYFRLADPAGDHGQWRPVALLYQPGTGPLDELLDSVRARLGGCERRVAASLFYQGFAARLLSPQLGCVAAGGCLPSLPADRLSWREPAAEMIQLGLGPGPGWHGPAGPLLDRLLEQSFTTHLGPLASAIRLKLSISAGLLQDNAASALVSGLRLLDPLLAARAIPPPEARADPFAGPRPGSLTGPEPESGWRPLAARALAGPTLRGSGTVTGGDPGFVRRSCCLYYRTASGGLCGDCPLR